ncbi:MAG: DUF3857 domain-containing protein [Ekhidna sp.]|nr:DUF3857 domain-containing protein [Ekhidna sp.]
MILRFYFLFIVVVSFDLNGQFEKYLGRSDINSVLLEDVTVFKIYDVESSEKTRSYKALILNEKASDLRNLVLHYDQFRTVDFFDLKVKNSQGIELDRFKLRDLNDYGYTSGIASDNRAKHISLENYDYPFIVEVEYSIRNNGSLFYPAWMPQREEGMLVKESKLIVEDVAANGIRYYPVSLEDPLVRDTVSWKKYVWKVKDLEPYQYDRWNSRLEDYTSYVLLAPFNFKMGDYSGKMDSWKSFGSWIGELNADRSSLQGLDLSELDSMITSDMGDKEKTAIVYHYLQNHTRYVSIQLGIGGWQPFPVSYVHQKKYGDCKALSNYAVALLDRYGVKAYYALINAGKYASTLQEGFPSAHFNHAVALVALDGDTTLLECTSQINPFGYSGTFTSNRNALLITEEGGTLVKTKKCLPEENLQSTNYQLSIGTNDRSIAVEMERTYEGIAIEESRFLSNYYENEQENREWFTDGNRFGSIHLSDFQLFPVEEGRIPKGGYLARFEKSGGVRKAGSRLLIDQANFFDCSLDKITTDSVERSIRIPYGFSQQDSLLINVPEGFYPKSLEEVDVETPYGKFHKKYIPSEGQLLIVRNFVFYDGVYGVEQFEGFKEFVNNVISNDRQKIVLLGNT